MPKSKKTIQQLADSFEPKMKKESCNQKLNTVRKWLKEHANPDYRALEPHLAFQGGSRGTKKEIAADTLTELQKIIADATGAPAKVVKEENLGLVRNSELSKTDKKKLEEEKKKSVAA